ncbi:MAG TPA: alpha/beta fold hydrolase [Polyangia bacterium]|jgi:proline iminopeptidase
MVVSGMLEVPGAQLFTVEVGDGPDLAVMLHGGPGASHDYLRPQLDALGEPGVRRLFYYDQRGGGRSLLAPHTPPGTWQDHVADLEAVRLHLGLHRLTLVGYSWGGLLAMLYALEHPSHVGALALISPAPATSAGHAEMRARLAAAPERPEVQAFKASLDLRDRRARFALAVAGYFVDPRRALELTPFLVQQRAEEAVWRSLGDYDLLPRLRALQLPAMVLHGDGDVIPLASAFAIAQALSAELVELPACGHVPYLEAPEPLFAALRRFLA